MAASGDTSSSEGPVPDPRLSIKAANFLVLFCVALMGFFDVMFWLTERGGVISLWAAFLAVRKHLASIVIDGSCLRLPMITLIGLFYIVASSFFKIHISRKLSGIIIGGIVIGSGFIIDGIFDHSLISIFMADHGYIRCSSGDLAIGNGKGRVWFEDYVASNQACVAPVQSAKPT